MKYIQALLFSFNLNVNVSGGSGIVEVINMLIFPNE